MNGQLHTYLYRQYLTSDGVVGVCGRSPPPSPNFNVGEQNLVFHFSELKFSIATTTLKFRGGGKAAPARLKLSIDEGWSVQHHDSEIYELRINIFSLYIYVQMYISAGPPLGGATRL